MKELFFYPESCFFPCGHSSQDIGQVVVMVIMKDACCKAPFVAGITIDYKVFIFGDFIQMPGEFADIDVMGTVNMADSAPVLYVPYVKDKGVFFF